MAGACRLRLAAAAAAPAAPTARCRLRRRLSLLLGLVLGLAAMRAAAAQPSPLDEATQARFPLDWSAVALIPPNTTNLTANCVCNLRLNQCDLGCCCDPACSPGLISFFESSGRCLPEGPPAQTLSFCVPKGYVFTVSAELRLRVECPHAHAARAAVGWTRKMHHTAYEHALCACTSLSGLFSLLGFLLEG